MSNIIHLEDDLSELKEYLPLNMKNPYFNIMFENLLFIDDTGFYNNAVINLTHFYNYILHCFLVQIYYSEENRNLLKYLQHTTGSLNSRDNQKQIKLDEQFDANSFSNVEKNTINYFFHIFNLCSNSHLCKNNNEIFDLRNSAAHLNMDIINENRFNSFIEKIKDNLNKLLNKTYKYSKKLLEQELSEAIKEGRIDEGSYPEIIEDINYMYGLSQNFYKLILHHNKFEHVKINSPQYYEQKYIEEVLGIEREEH